MNRTTENFEKLVNPSETTRNCEAGFTILETAIAMVIMAVVALGVASLFAYAASNTVTAADRELATAVAQQSMEQLRNATFTDTALAATSTAGTSSTVARAGRQYLVITTIADSNLVNGLATSKAITVSATPQSGTSKWATSVSSLFGSVKLVSVRTSLLTGPNRAF